MANATSDIAGQRISSPLDRTEKAALDAAAGTIFQGALVGRDSSGYFTKGDDTQYLTEMAVNVSAKEKVDSAEPDGSHEIDVKRGVVAKFTIATLTSDANARSKYGRPVFAAFDNEVSLNDGSYANFVGFILGHDAGTYTSVYVYIPPLSRLQGRKLGDLTNPQVWDGADEWEEIYVGCSAAASDKALMRHRALPTAAQTTGVLTTHSVQCYGSPSGYNVYGLRAGNFEVGIKAATTLLTGGVMCPLRAKVEDLGFDLTAEGTATVTGFEVAAQLSTGTTIAGEFSLVRVQHEGNIAADQFFYFGPAGGMAREVGVLIKTAATVAQSSNFLSAGSLTDSGSGDVACDARFKCDFGGTAYYIPLFDTAA